MPAPGAFLLPGALSAAQLGSIAGSVAAQRRSIEALKAQLSAFDEQLAVLEQILAPLADWSRTWAELEQRLLMTRRAPEAEGTAWRRLTRERRPRDCLAACTSSMLLTWPDGIESVLIPDARHYLRIHACSLGAGSLGVTTFPLPSRRNRASCPPSRRARFIDDPIRVGAVFRPGLPGVFGPELLLEDRQ